MFELKAVQEAYKETSDEHPKSLYDLIGYDSHIPKKNGFTVPFAIFRCSVDQMLAAKETEKAIGIDIADNPQRLAWIPKSVILEWHPGNKIIPRGFVVSKWFAENNAQSGGPYYFMPDLELINTGDSDAELLLSCLLEIGTTADREKVNAILDASDEARENVWQGIFRNIQIGYKDWDHYWSANAVDSEMKQTANALYHIRRILLDL